MKSRTSHLLAALLLGAAPLPYAQSAQPTPVEPDPLQPPAGLISEPVASVSRDDPVADTIARALNAEPSLKNSKITVTPAGNDVILLTGSTTSEAHKIRATEIARARAGDDKVVNTLAHDENVIWVPDPKPAAEETREPADTPQPSSTGSSEMSQG